MPSRKILVGILVGAAAAAGLWQLYSGWGTVSLDFENAPLGKVLAAISRQGGIEIASDLDPSTPVSIQVRRASALEALDIVSVRTEASWRLAYLGAREQSEIDTVLAAFRAGQEIEGWTTHEAGGFGMVQSRTGVPLDLRLVEWRPQSSGDLQSLLAQAAEETGITMAAPADWSPQIGDPPSGSMKEAAPGLFAQAGGVSREVFLLRGPEPGEEPSDEGGNWRGPRAWIGAAPSSERRETRGAFGLGDPERAAKRAEAQIKLLPKEEREKAREDLSLMREFRESAEGLPEEQRRAKAREFFNRPEVQERMEDRRLARYAKMTPQQRIERSQRYWKRKAEAKYRRDGNR